MINNKLICDFAEIIGKLTIAINLESLKDAKADYEMVLKKLIKWVKYYYKHNNLDIVTYDESLKIHQLLVDKSCDLMTDTNILGSESILSDDILIRYEVIIKSINGMKSANQ